MPHDSAIPAEAEIFVKDVSVTASQDEPVKEKGVVPTSTIEGEVAGGSKFPTPHLGKLEKLLQNGALPATDRPRVEAAIPGIINGLPI